MGLVHGDWFLQSCGGCCGVCKGGHVLIEKAEYEDRYEEDMEDINLSFFIKDKFIINGINYCGINRVKIIFIFKYYIP